MFGQDLAAFGVLTCPIYARVGNAITHFELKIIVFLPLSRYSGFPLWFLFGNYVFIYLNY